MLDKIAMQGNNRLTDFERRHSIFKITSVIGDLPTEYITNAISYYQKIIVNNTWYFPTLKDVDLSSFLVRWADVHKAYFDIAEEIYILLEKGEPIESLTTPGLLTKVIQSESMRGWVGKLSPSGLDALLAARVRKLEWILASLDDDTLESIFYYGGIYMGNPELVSAEKDCLNLFAAYHREMGEELTVGGPGENNEAARALLRNYCRYSVKDFNKKYNVLCKETQNPHDISADMAYDIVEKQIAPLPSRHKVLIRKLLEEVRMLNYLNLNLEVKYSFKGFAGLMHVLVFMACREATGIETDVYAMLDALLKIKKERV